MVFLVPYDGSPVAEAALERAVDYGAALDADVLAVCFVPTGTEFAERRTWVDPAEDASLEATRRDLDRKIDQATDETELVYEEQSAGSPDDGIGTAVRQTATDVGASVVFVGIGAESADDDLRTRFGTISTDGEYDVHVVREP